MNQSEVVYAFLNPRPEYYSRQKTTENSLNRSEPFFRISKKLLAMSQNSPADEFGNKAVGLRDIYSNKKDIEAEMKETSNRKLQDTKSVLPSSISNFFNDTNSETSASVGVEQARTRKLEFRLSKG